MKTIHKDLPTHQHLKMDIVYTHVGALYIYLCEQLVIDIADHFGELFPFHISQVIMVYLDNDHCMIYPFEGSVESLKNCVSRLQSVQSWTESNSNLCAYVVKRNTGYEVDKNRSK